MQRIPDSPPAIAPVAQGVYRPKWSIMIPAYNCSEYLIDTIESVLLQDQGPERMQIEVVDDCSTDADVADLVAKVGKGRVSYYRQQQNVGSLRNFETCLNRALGYYIHLLHGDDRVLDGFYNELGKLLDDNPFAGAAFCRWNDIDQFGYRLQTSTRQLDEAGVILGFYDKISKLQLLQVVTIAVKREVYERLGSFYAVTYGEDWEMWARIAFNYPVLYTPKTLAEYRIHYGSITANSLVSGTNIDDIVKISTLVNMHHPRQFRAKSIKAFKNNYALYAWCAAYAVWAQHKKISTAHALMRKVLQLSKNHRIVYLSCKIYLLSVFASIYNRSSRIKQKSKTNSTSSLGLNEMSIDLHHEDFPIADIQVLRYRLLWKNRYLDTIVIQPTKDGDFAKQWLVAIAPVLDKYISDIYIKANYKKAIKSGDLKLFRSQIAQIFDAPPHSSNLV